MVEFMDRYGTDEKCAAALERSRRPTSFRCPDCRDGRHSRFVCEGRTYWQYPSCRTQTTVTSGTIFQVSKLPLSRWFLAMYPLTQAKNNVSALELKRPVFATRLPGW